MNNSLRKDRSDDTGKATAYNRIISEDGFVYGIVVPWGWAKGYASDIGPNQAYNKGSDFSIEKWTEIFCNCKAIGFNCIRIWLFEVMEGIICDDTGDVLGIHEEFMTNLKSLLDLAVSLDINLEVTLQCHTSISLSTNIDLYNRYTQLQFDVNKRKNYIEKVVTPVCKLLGEYIDNIAAIHIFAEPEGDTNGEWGNQHQPYGTVWGKIADHIRQVGAKVREIIPGAMITSSSGWQGFENLRRGNFNDLDLDIIGADIYNDKGEVFYDTANNKTYGSLEELNLSKPAWISEFGAISSKNWSDDFQSKTTVDMYKSAREAGYKGAFLWMYGYPESSESLTVVGKNGDLRPVAGAVKFFLSDIRKERSGDKGILDRPTMVYGHDVRRIKWLGSRNAARYRIERSQDMISWVTAADHLTPLIVDNGSGLCTFTDRSALFGHKYFYRVTVYDKDGNFLVSGSSSWYQA
mgnify:FL=1